MNYHHLRYFHAAAREGGVNAAAEKLHVSQSAVSSQIRKLEQALGHELFDRSGRSLTLTPEGKVALEYADQIFSLGQQLEDTVQGQLKGRPLRLQVGIASTIPNLVSFQLLEGAFELADPARLVVRENRTDRLLADLATHDLDMVLADMRIPPNVSVRAWAHLLGRSPVDIMAPPLVALRLRDGFPASLEGQPFLLPTEGYTLRRSLDEWFARERVRPRVVAEIEDTDLINVFAEAGAGAFAVPSIISDDIRVRYAVELVGRADGVAEEYYAITSERRIQHPAIAAIAENARRELIPADATSPSSSENAGQ